MKKLFSITLAFCLLFSLSACKKKSQNPIKNTTPTTAPIVTEQVPSYNPPLETDDTLISVFVPAITETATHDDGTVLFQYTSQEIFLVTNNPQVADKISEDFMSRVRSTAAAADSTKQMAQNAYNGSSNWISYLYHLTYSPTRIDHKVLSFFGNNVVFTGTGHPERTCVSASYDFVTGDVLTLASIKTKDSTTEQFCNLVLEELAKIKDSKQLYENYQDTVRQRFTKDASQDEEWYFSQDGLCFYFAPYDIAPYASGVITVEIPYSKLGNMLHNAYLPLGRNASEGAIKVSPFDQVNLDNFSDFTELVTEGNGKMYMLHTDKTLQDIRIIYEDKSVSYTIFATYNLITDHGIMVQGSDETLKNMKISYKSGSQTLTMPII